MFETGGWKPRCAVMLGNAFVLTTLLLSQSIRAQTSPVIGFSGVDGVAGQLREATVELRWLSQETAAGLQFDIVARGDAESVIVRRYSGADSGDLLEQREITPNESGAPWRERVVVASRRGWLPRTTGEEDDPKTFGMVQLEFKGLGETQMELALENVVIANTDGASFRVTGESGYISLAAAEIPERPDEPDEPMTPPMIVGLNLSPGFVVLELNGDEGVRLQVEASENLNSWTSVGQVTVQDGRALFVESNVEFARRYYRVRSLR